MQQARQIIRQALDQTLRTVIEGIVEVEKTTEGKEREEQQYWTKHFIHQFCATHGFDENKYMKLYNDLVIKYESEEYP